MNEKQFLITEDGSHTIYLPELDETYHSTHGAIRESEHVFIQNGLKYYNEKEGSQSVRIFELGFGTGLNALLSAIFALEHKISIQYEGIEAYPLNQKEIDKLNFTALLDQPTAKTFFDAMHTSPWNQQVNISPNFGLKKIKNTIQDYTTDSKFDICFFDAFAPSKQAEMWELPILKKVYSFLSSNGVFVTYCAKGQLKRDLKSIGFKVESLPGPPGKFEMVRATKT